MGTPVTLIELGLSILEAGDPLRDGDAMDLGAKPVFIQVDLSASEKARVAALCGRWGLSEALVVRLAVGTGIRWSDAARA
jgi:hypothetical protein